MLRLAPLSFPSAPLHPSSRVLRRSLAPRVSKHEKVAASWNELAFPPRLTSRSREKTQGRSTSKPRLTPTSTRRPSTTLGGVAGIVCPPFPEKKGGHWWTEKETETSAEDPIEEYHTSSSGNGDSRENEEGRVFPLGILRSEGNRRVVLQTMASAHPSG